MCSIAKTAIIHLHKHLCSVETLQASVSTLMLRLETQQTSSVYLNKERLFGCTISQLPRFESPSFSSAAPSTIFSTRSLLIPSKVALTEETEASLVDSKKVFHVGTLHSNPVKYYQIPQYGLQPKQVSAAKRASPVCHCNCNLFHQPHCDMACKYQ